MMSPVPQPEAPGVGEDWTTLACIPSPLLCTCFLQPRSGLLASSEAVSAGPGLSERNGLESWKLLGALVPCLVGFLG